jgi:hypothetical protein
VEFTVVSHRARAGSGEERREKNSQSVQEIVGREIVDREMARYRDREIQR